MHTVRPFVVGLLLAAILLFVPLTAQAENATRAAHSPTLAVPAIPVLDNPAVAPAEEPREHWCAGLIVGAYAYAAMGNMRMASILIAAYKMDGC